MGSSLKFEWYGVKFGLFLFCKFNIVNVGLYVYVVKECYICCGVYVGVDICVYG